MFKLSETIILQAKKPLDNSYINKVIEEVVKGREKGVVVIPKDFELVRISEKDN